MREEWFIRSIVVIRSQMFHDIHQITSPLCHSSGQITMPMWSPSQIPLLLVIELGYQQWLRWATCPIWRKCSFISRARGCFWRFSMHFLKALNVTAPEIKNAGSEYRVLVDSQKRINVKTTKWNWYCLVPVTETVK